MIALALAGLIAFANGAGGSSVTAVERVQFRGGPNGQCPDGYDFNYANGRCYPNDYRAPGYYSRSQPRYYGGRGGQCPDGYDFNYSNGNCYPNRARAPGAYGGPQYGRRGGLCPDGYDYNYSNGQCYPNGARVPGLYGR